MVLRFFEPEKASEPLVRFFGITILVKLSISPKARRPMSVTLVGSVMLVNFVPLNAWSPIFVNVLGKTISFKLEPEKASEPISVIPVGSVMLVSFVPLNA